MRWLINTVFRIITKLVYSAPGVIWSIITLEDYPPRRKWIWFIVGLIFGGAIVFGLTFPAYEELRLLGEGVEVRGRVLDKTVREATTEDGDTLYEYRVHYEFDAGLGDPPDVRQEWAIVNEDTYNRSILREPITVRFLYDEPEINSVQPSVDYRDDLNRLLAAFGFYMVFLLIVALNAAQVILQFASPGKANP